VVTNGGSIGIGVLDRLDSDQPIAAGTVLDDDVAIQKLAHLLDHQTA